MATDAAADNTGADAPIRYAADNGVAVITLDRPPANALSSAMYTLLAEVAERVSAEPSVRVAILTAANPRMFSGGADVKELATLDSAGRAAFFEISGNARRKFAAIPVPIIAAVTGACVGAGVSYATRCDYRIASETAFFAMPEIDRGSVAGGGVDLMSIGVPSGALRMMLFSGRRYSAFEAQAMHLVDEVVPPEQLQAVAADRAAAIAAKPRNTLIEMKRAIKLMAFNVNWSDEGYVETQRVSSELMQRAETQEGIAAFLEKRAPNYESAS